MGTFRVIRANVWQSVLCAFIACGVRVDAATRAQPVEYRNSKYGISLKLSPRWQGYRVLHQQWMDQHLGRKHLEEGPIIVLRNPRWTAKHPYQDIPILVFTRRQWRMEHEGKIFPYAGGVLDELSHNRKYVLAIYSRFDFGDDVKGRRVADELVGRNMHPYRQNVYVD